MKTIYHIPSDGISSIYDGDWSYCGLYFGAKGRNIKVAQKFQEVNCKNCLRVWKKRGGGQS